MKILHSDEAPAAIGPYSHAIQTGNLVFLSWQIGVDPTSMTLVSDSVSDQAHQACKNIQSVLKSQWMDIGSVVKTTVFLSDMADFATVNEIYGSYFSHKPARSTVAVRELPRGAKVEIECIAEVSSL